MKILLAICAAMGVAAAQPKQPPNQMLWHWFSNGDVRFLKPQQAGVAFHALSIALKGKSEVVSYPRRSPVPLSPGVYRMAVIRIEDRGAMFTEVQRMQTTRMIQEIAALLRVPAIQIDFDAPKSARIFYRALVADVRQRIGRNVFLSITALTSWCEPGSWLARLDVEEIVPMAFDMGPGGPAVTALLKSGGKFGFAGCRGSLGMSLTEGSLPVGSGQRIYLFANNQRWSPALVSSTLQRYSR
jgi:hypothetical protein